jgi:hypothetical protein
MQQASQTAATTSTMLLLVSCLDDPVLPSEVSGGEDKPVSVDGVEEPGFHGGFSLPGSPYPGVAALPMLLVPVLRK